METAPIRQKELETILHELNTIKPNAKVYKQLPNSNIFFRAKVDTIKSETHNELDKLLKKEDK